MKPIPVEGGRFKCPGACLLLFDSQIGSNETCPGCFAPGPFLDTRPGDGRVIRSMGTKGKGCLPVAMALAGLFGLLLPLIVVKSWFWLPHPHTNPAVPDAGHERLEGRIRELTNSLELLKKKLSELEKEASEKHERGEGAGNQELPKLRTRVQELAKLEGELLAQVRSMEVIIRESNSQRDSHQAASRGMSKRISELEGEVARLAKENRMMADAIRIDAGRPTPIVVTGLQEEDLDAKRVVVVMDASGSMELENQFERSSRKRKAAEKLAGRLLEGIPGLEYYQVVVMGLSSSWLEGNGEWIRHIKGKTGGNVANKLSQVEVKGGTDMHKAMNLAFSKRKDGLEMIALIADGGPTAGEGLDERQKESLAASEKHKIIGIHLLEKIRKVWNNPASPFPVVRINTIGLFYEGTGHGEFLWTLSHENHGHFAGLPPFKD